MKLVHTLAVPPGCWPEEPGDSSEVEIPSTVGMLESLQKAGRERRLLVGGPIQYGLLT